MSYFNFEAGVYTDESKIGKQIKTALKHLEHTDSTQFKITIDGKDFVRQIDTYSRKSGELIKIQRDLIEVTNQYGTSLENVSKYFNKDAFQVTEVKNAYDHMRTLTTEVQKYINKEGERVTEITEANDKGEQYIKVIKQTTNSLGEVITRTQMYDKAMNPLGNEITKIDRTVQTATKDFHKFKDAMGNTVTEITETANNGIRTIHRTIEGVDDLGRNFKRTEEEIINANGVTKVLNKGLTETTYDEVKLAEETRKTNVQLNNQAGAVNKASNSIKRTDGVVNDFVSTMGKVLKFQIITKIITGFTTACREAIDIVKEFDTALTEMKKVSDYTGESLDKYTQKLGELGKAVARTRTQMVEGATQFIKAGYDEETSAQLAQVSALFSNIADSELDAGQSATFVISQMKAFRTELEALGDEGKQAIYVIDAINEVSNNTAVSSTDISTALSKTASAMSALGNDYHQTIALVTAGTEIMQGQASKVARGLRSFGNQIAKTATSAGELSFEVQGATKSIALMTEDGNLKSTYEVLQEISKEWDNMTSAERQALGISLAGKTQFEVFTSVLNNFADAERALTLAKESENSAWKENARYMESIEARYQALKTAVENFVLGDGGLEKLVKNVLDISTKIVKLIDDCGGLITVMGMLTGAMVVLNSNGILKLISGFVLLAKNAEFATLSFIATGQAITTTGAVINMTVPVIGALVLGFTALIAIVNYVNTAYDRHLEKVKELNSEIDIENSKVKEIESELGKVYEKINEINNLDGLDITDEKELRNLHLQSVELERQLAIEKERLRIAQEKQEAEANKFLTANPSREEEELITGKTGATASVLLYGKDVDFAKKSDNLDVRISKYIEIKKALEDYILELQEENKNLDENDSAYKKNEQLMFSASKTAQAYSSIIDSLVQDLDNATVGLNEQSAVRQAYIKVYNDYADSLLENTSAEEKNAEYQEIINEWLQDTIETLGLTEEQQSELNYRIQEATKNLGSEDDILSVVNDTITEYENEINQATQETRSWSEELDEIQSAYGVLSNAVNEYNESQALSIDTIQSLMALGSDYLSMLDFENGKLVLNEQAIYNKVKAQIEQAKATVYQEAVERLEILTAEKHQEATENSTSATKNDTTALDENTDALLRNAKANFADAMGKARREKVSEKEIKAIVDDMNNQLKLLDDVLLNVGKNFTTAMSSGSKATDKANKSTSSANKTLKETNTELEKLKKNISDLKDEISEYEKIFSYLGGKLDEEIDKLEKAKDNETDAIDKQIDALEELKDTLEESSKERIDQLEKEKNALIDANKLEINTLQEKQNAEEEYWNNKIQALKDANSELESQIELEQLLANLEKAKNTKVRVYKKGQGYVWDTDQNAVSEAQKKIDEYNRKKNYEEQLAELENFKKKSQDNYEQQINNLKTLNDNIKNEYDKQIEELKENTDNKVKDYERQIKELNNLKTEIENHYKFEIDNLNNYKENLEKQSKSYETEQNRLLTLERTGIDTEQANWTERLNNLDKFVTEYNNKLAELDAKQKQLKEMEGKTSSTTSSSGDAGGGSTTIATTDNNGGSRRRQVWYVGNNKFYSQKDVDDFINDRKAQIDTIQNQNAFIKMAIARESNPNVKDQLKQKLTNPPDLPTVTTDWENYGGGASAIGSNQFAIVGDNPNKEILIGSKLNGLGLKLAKGTGIVNAKSTGTLAGLFNMLGSELGKGINGSYNLSNNNTQTSQNIHIDNITLPEVRDAEDFINALSNFENIMVQKAYAT